MNAAYGTVLGFSLAAILLGWSLFEFAQLARPPLGVFSLADICVMLGAVC